MPVKKNNEIIAEETVNNLRRLFQVVNKQSKKVVLEPGLTGPQLWAVNVLSDEAGEAMTVSKLADKMCLNASTVVRILDGLEEKGLVQRVRNTIDRRVVFVNLTQKGTLLISQSPKVANNLLIDGLKSLSANKLYTMAAVLSQLVNILETGDSHPEHYYASKSC